MCILTSSNKSQQNENCFYSILLKMNKKYELLHFFTYFIKAIEKNIKEPRVIGISSSKQRCEHIVRKRPQQIVRKFIWIFSSFLVWISYMCVNWPFLPRTFGLVGPSFGDVLSHSSVQQFFHSVCFYVRCGSFYLRSFRLTPYHIIYFLRHYCSPKLYSLYNEYEKGRET